MSNNATPRSPRAPKISLPTLLMRWMAVPLALVCFGSLAARAGESTPPSRDAVRDFVGSNMLGIQDDPELPKIVRRWTKSPSISLSSFDANAKETAFVKGAVDQVNTALNGVGVSLQNANAGDEGSDIQVYFVPYWKVRDFIRDHKLKLHKPHAYSDTWATTAADHSLTKVLILLPIDTDKNKDLEHFVLSSIAGAMGIMNGAPFVSNSLLKVQMDATDNMVLNFLYTKLHIGDDLDKALAAFDEFWPPTEEAPPSN